MGEDKLIDQSQLAQDLSKKIPYEFRNTFLVKPLDPVKVKKEFNKPVPADAKPKKDENGVEAVDFDKVETEVKEVDADFRKGVVLKIPFDYMRSMEDEKYPSMPINIGDIVIYKDKYAVWYDLLKDTQLVGQYEIIAIENNKNESTESVPESGEATD